MAQGGAGAARRQTPSRSTKPADSTIVRKTPAGYVLDFQDQPLRVVLSAIAEAGGLNVALTNIPARNVTLRMGQGMSRDSMAMVLRSIAEANGLRFANAGPLINIEGTPPAPIETAAQRTQQAEQQLVQALTPPPLKLFTYRLKHASATTLAPVLMSLFAGAGLQGTNGFTVIPNGNGGFTTINTAAVGNALGAAANGRGGRGGAGGGFGANGAANPVNPNIATNGGGGRGTVGVGFNGNAVAQPTAPGALSSQANQIRIVAEESSNALLVRATDSDWALIQQIVSGIDLRPLQVLIEVTIAEVTRTNDLNFGISGSVSRHKTGGVDSLGVAPVAATTTGINDFILALTGGHGTIDYNVAISALQERGDVRVLSLPVIIAQNNKQAVLTVGQSVPFVQVSQSLPEDPSSFVQTVQYQDVGTVLTITPTINPDGYVNMAVDQQDNSATNEVQFNAPIISKREANTQIFLHDGQTTVIGGLSGSTRNHTTSGIPILSRIPIIGPALFGGITQDDDETELFLFLTPHVITTDQDIDQLRDAVKNHSELLKTVPIGPNIVPASETLHVYLDSAKRLDSLKKADSTRLRPPTSADSMRTLRRRPPAPAPADSTTLSSALPSARVSARGRRSMFAA
jgi:general secretion pathway protein D